MSLLIFETKKTQYFCWPPAGSLKMCVTGTFMKQKNIQNCLRLLRAVLNVYNWHLFETKHTQTFSACAPINKKNLDHKSCITTV